MNINWGGRKLAMLFGVLAGCQTMTNDPLDLSKAWDNGAISVPALAFADGYKRQGSIDVVLPKLAGAMKPGQKLPIIVFAHGCTGLASEGRKFIELVSANGYAVVAPSSLARPSRNFKAACNPRNKTFSALPYHLRLAEMSEAYKRLLALPWVDKMNIFLAGFSEGGGTAVRYQGSEFKGIIALGTNCGGPGHRGISAPLRVPVLVIYGNKDEWSSQFDFHCHPQQHDGPSRLLRLQRSGHAVLHDPQAREAVLSFLSALRGG
ncbi:MAG: alpha/beta hydrolase [Rhodospirillaceae bacterium]|jgi:dienelactone hydrolase|nr:alpha/beta hydrolase [Rhodospirillaceae bacterium]MBT6431145.1 alpha/beta hydrolase [Rhodospirillaceae bacterium]MBT6987586.1 alpha/beta hydrolase [Rhodospirillaceae bacterium]MBT7760701.1 alpha/beta hydrolase [Rhodospirillaceae bacterium]